MDAKTDPIPSEGKELTAIDIDRILQLLPHRYPFLMIDRIVEVDGDTSAIGIKNVSVNEPIFQGHFPGNPVFRRAHHRGHGADGRRHRHRRRPDQGAARRLHGHRRQVQFRKPARPGDTIEYHIRKIRRQRDGLVRGAALVGATLIAEAEVGAMVTVEDN